MENGSGVPAGVSSEAPPPATLEEAKTEVRELRRSLLDLVDASKQASAFLPGVPRISFLNAIVTAETKLYTIRRRTQQ